MKFSYSLLKKLVPSLPSKEKAIKALNLHVFEAADERGDVIEVSVPPNRFSDASSHAGLARELAALFRLKFPWGKKFDALLAPGALAPFAHDGEKTLSVEVKTKECARYTAAYFEGVKIKKSPAWITRTLRACGIRPINNVVDIMNYVMLETGQPMHAFDGDKIEDRKIIVRKAKKGEAMVTLSGDRIALDGSELVIADTMGPLGLAGIKGGKRAEVDAHTERVVIEAANFDGTRIYRTSRKFGLLTDAAQRFSRRISPDLTQAAVLRAASLLREIAGAQEKMIIDRYPLRQPMKTVRLDESRIGAIAGYSFPKNEITRTLARLGFSIGKASRIIIPPLREDIETIDDIAEEVVRVFGYDRIPAVPPRAHLHPSGYEDRIVLKDLMRNTLKGLGYDEVYTSSFISKEAGEKYGNIGELIAPSNPFSSDYFYLRPSIADNLAESARENMKFLDEVRIFEIGHAFRKSERGTEEIQMLGMAASSKEDEFFSLKGAWNALVASLGIVNSEFIERARNRFDIVSGKKTIGLVYRTAEKGRIYNVLEARLDALLKLAEKEREFLPLPKYPAIIRDLSVIGREDLRVGDLMHAIRDADERIVDVDIIDEYGENLAFRIVFQSDARTLTDAEVDEAMKKVAPRVKSGFGLQIR